MRGHLSLEMWLLQPSFRFRCILVTTETVPRGHSARRGAGSQAATRSLPTLRPSRHRALRVPWRHSLLVSAPYVPGSVQRSSAQGLPWLWRSCVFLSSDWLLGLVGDRFDPSDPRTPAGSAGTPPQKPARGRGVLRVCSFTARRGRRRRRGRVNNGTSVSALSFPQILFEILHKRGEISFSWSKNLVW